MRTFVAPVFVLLAVLGLAIPVAGCGQEEDETPSASEGQPLELGGLVYNVAITRFLNPNIVEDAAYLEGAEVEPTGQSYLGVFILIKNEHEDGDPIPSASEYTIVDGSHRTYEPVDLETPFSLEIGAEVAPEGVLPEPDSVAAAGPTQGALLLFLVDDDVSEERPLELEINAGTAGEGFIELDI
jgi:hypothetical protein